MRARVVKSTPTPGIAENFVSPSDLNEALLGLLLTRKLQKGEAYSAPGLVEGGWDYIYCLWAVQQESNAGFSCKPWPPLSGLLELCPDATSALLCDRPVSNLGPELSTPLLLLLPSPSLSRPRNLRPLFANHTELRILTKAS